MPKVPTTCAAELEFEAVLAAWREFGDGFQRSRRTGNLWRHWDGMTIVVFKRPGEGRCYAWSIAKGKSVRFSRASFEVEGDGLDALAAELGVGQF